MVSDEKEALPGNPPAYTPGVRAELGGRGGVVGGVGGNRGEVVGYGGEDGGVTVSEMPGVEIFRGYEMDAKGDDV